MHFWHMKRIPIITRSVSLMVMALEKEHIFLSSLSWWRGTMFHYFSGHLSIKSCWSGPDIQAHQAIKTVSICWNQLWMLPVVSQNFSSSDTSYQNQKSVMHLILYCRSKWFVELIHPNLKATGLMAWVYMLGNSRVLCTANHLDL